VVTIDILSMQVILGFTIYAGTFIPRNACTHTHGKKERERESKGPSKHLL